MRRNVSQRASEVLARNRCVLLDFDGPVCAVFGGVTDRAVALQLADELGVRIDWETTSDPFVVLRKAAAASPARALAAHDAFTRLEVAAVETAPLTPGIVELLDHLERSHRLGIVSNNSAVAVRGLLAARNLTRYVAAIAARTDPDPALLKPNPHLVHVAMAALEMSPADCVLIGDSKSDIDAARAAGTAVIAYANKPGKRAGLEASRPDAIVEDLSELVLQDRG